MQKFILLIFIFTNAPALVAKEIRVLADPWCPYTCTPGSDKEGVIIDMMREAFKGTKHSVKYVERPWTRAIEEARSGKAEAIAGAYLSDAPGFVAPDVSQGYSTSCFYTQNSSNWKYSGNTKSLENLKVGVIEGYAYDDILDPYIASNKSNRKRIDVVSGVDTMTKLIKKLDAGRIDTFVDDTPVVEYNLAEMGGKISFRNAGCTKSQRLFALFSPKNPNSRAFAKILSDGMLKLYSTKKIHEIYSRYGLEEPPPLKLLK